MGTETSFTNCPRCAFDLSSLAGTRYCPNCGFDLVKAAEARRGLPDELPRPLGCWTYAAIGIASSFGAFLVPALILYILIPSGVLSEQGQGLFAGIGGVILLIAMVCYYPAAIYLATRGRYGTFSIYGAANNLLFLMIPFIAWSVVADLGKGIYMVFTRQRFAPRSASKAGLIILLVGAVIAIAAGVLTADELAPALVPDPTPISVRPTSTRRPPTPVATKDACISWNEVSASMKGDVVCVRGRVTKLTQTRQVGSRYEFSDRPNTFFLYSQMWEIFDMTTGKTLGVGTCMEVTGTIELQSGVPYINIDRLGGGHGQEIPGITFTTAGGPCD